MPGWWVWAWMWVARCLVTGMNCVLCVQARPEEGGHGAARTVVQVSGIGFCVQRSGREEGGHGRPACPLHACTCGALARPGAVQHTTSARPHSTPRLPPLGPAAGPGGIRRAGRSAGAGAGRTARCGPCRRGPVPLRGDARRAAGVGAARAAAGHRQAGGTGGWLDGWLGGRPSVCAGCHDPRLATVTPPPRYVEPTRPQGHRPASLESLLQPLRPGTPAGCPPPPGTTTPPLLLVPPPARTHIAPLPSARPSLSSPRPRPPPCPH